MVLVGTLDGDGCKTPLSLSSRLTKSRSFILEGLLTVLVGAVSYFLMADFPEKAKFLDEDERSWVLHRVKYRGSSGPNKIAETDQFKWKYVWAAFLDWQIWLAIITDMAASCTIYGEVSLEVLPCNRLLMMGHPFSRNVGILTFDRS